MENLRKIFNGIEYVEEWKDIEGYEGSYAISTFGRVKSLERFVIYKGNSTRKVHGVVMKGQNNRGYLSVIFRKNNAIKSFKIHRLVADAFIPNLENKYAVNHINEDKHHNFYLNLEWATCRENKNYSANRKSTSNLAGASWSKSSNSWRSQSWMNGKLVYIGSFKTDIEAHDAYVDFCTLNNLR